MGKIRKILCLTLAVLLVLPWHRQKQLPGEMSVQELNRQAEKVESAVANLSTEDINHQRNLAKWYNYNLELGTAGLEGAYETILNFGQGRMAVLGIPEWQLRMPIHHGGGGVANHDPATYLPLGGRGQHTIVYLTEYFPWTGGMSLYIDCLGQRLTYRVERVQITDEIEPQEEGENLLTLVYDRGESRTLIRCTRCAELVLRQEEMTEDGSPVALGLLVPLLALGWICRRKRSAKYLHKGRFFGFCRKNRGKTKLS